ncbi:MAG: hypothetical protein ACRC3B_19520, partial [Bacteroidia bacterium]
PQLLPYTDLKPEFRLVVSGDVESGEGEELIDALKNCAIDWEDGETLFTAYVEVSQSDNGLNVSCSVDGSKVKSSFTVNRGDAENGGKMLAYHLFGINKQTLGEPEEELIEVEATDKTNADSLRNVK